MFEYSVFKYLEDFGIDIFDRVFSAIWYRSVKYGIDFNIKENKEVIISTGVWYEEPTCFIVPIFPVMD